MRFVSSILKEPLLHFLLIGCAIFAVFKFVDESPSAVKPDVIIVTEAEAEGLAASFARTWRRPPNDDELAALIEDRVREEVFVKEAIALGMDQNDTVVRRRLRQKMEFLAASIVEAIEPEDAALKDFYRTQGNKFEQAAQVAFEQVFLGESAADSDVATGLEMLRAHGDPGEIGVRSLIPAALPLSSAGAVDGTFGLGFFERLAALPTDDWAGPVKSGYGVHLVRITERSESAQPPFETVREKVLREWRAATQKELMEQQYGQLRERYEVSVPKPEAVGRAAQ